MMIVECTKNNNNANIRITMNVLNIDERCNERVISSISVQKQATIKLMHSRTDWHARVGDGRLCTLWEDVPWPGGGGGERSVVWWVVIVPSYLYISLHVRWTLTAQPSPYVPSHYIPCPHVQYLSLTYHPLTYPPSRILSSCTLSSRTLPLRTLPLRIIPSRTILSRTLPLRTFPSRTLPSRTLPLRTLPPHQHPQVRPRVCFLLFIMVLALLCCA